MREGDEERGAPPLGPRPRLQTEAPRRRKAAGRSEAAVQGDALRGPELPHPQVSEATAPAHSHAGRNAPHSSWEPGCPRAAAGRQELGGGPHSEKAPPGRPSLSTVSGRGAGPCTWPGEEKAEPTRAGRAPGTRGSFGRRGSPAGRPGPESCAWGRQTQCPSPRGKDSSLWRSAWCTPTTR